MSESLSIQAISSNNNTLYSKERKWLIGINGKNMQHFIKYEIVLSENII